MTKRVGVATVTVMLALLGQIAAPAQVRADELPAPLKHAKAEGIGTVLTGPSNMTLYIFNRDTAPGKSECNGACAENWPPFKPVANAPAPRAPLSVINRDDGSKQYAWKGKPLYFWHEDAKPGDVTGHRRFGTWFAAQP